MDLSGTLDLIKYRSRAFVGAANQRIPQPVVIDCMPDRSLFVLVVDDDKKLLDVQRQAKIKFNNIDEIYNARSIFSLSPSLFYLHSSDRMSRRFPIQSNLMGDFYVVLLSKVI